MAFALAIMFASPTAAQIQGQSSDRSVDPATPGTNYTWNLSFNPAFGDDLNISDDRITNENTISATLGVRHNWRTRTYIAGTLGLEASPAFISHLDLPGAAALAELRLGQRLLLGSAEDAEGNRDALDFHVAYQFKQGFETEDDARREFSDHQYGVELSYQNIFWLLSQGPRQRRQEWEEGPAVELTAGFARLDSNLAKREKEVFTATGELTVPLHRFPDLAFELAFERSRYDEPVDGQRRRDDTLSAFVGFDLSDQLDFLPVLDEAGIGLRFTQNLSTIEAEDDRSVQLQLVIAFGETNAIRRQ